MCHSSESRPPEAPGDGPAVHGYEVTLEASDGNRFAGYAARAAQPLGSGVIILPDVRGLHPYYCALAERFAEIAIDAVAIDYFGRTAGAARREEGFPFRPHYEQTTPAGVAADSLAAARFLRSLEGGSVSSVFAVGFCFGGSNAWRLSAELPGLAGGVGFYGHAHRVADVIARMRAPLLMIAAGADAGIPAEDIVNLAQTVREAGCDAEAVVYEGAPHSFFDRHCEESRPACDDAWRRIGEFIEAHSNATPAP